MTDKDTEYRELLTKLRLDLGVGRTQAICDRAANAIDSLLAERDRLRAEVIEARNSLHIELSREHDRYNEQGKHAEALFGALDALYSLVNGECPSLLEDDHHGMLVDEALDAYRAWKEGKK